MTRVASWGSSTSSALSTTGNKPAVDKINPAHYKSHPSGVECIQVTRHMSFNLGNVVKYLWRAGLKDSSPTIEDLKKARWYLEDEIGRLEKEASGFPFDPIKTDTGTHELLSELADQRLNWYCLSCDTHNKVGDKCSSCHRPQPVKL